MSTLSEIEAAVDKLPHPEQEILLEHLARKLGVRPPITEGSRAQREAGCKSSTGCGTAGLPSSDVHMNFKRTPTAGGCYSSVAGDRLPMEPSELFARPIALHQ